MTGSWTWYLPHINQHARCWKSWNVIFQPQYVRLRRRDARGCLADSTMDWITYLAWQATFASYRSKLLSQRINPAANLQDIKDGTIASRRRNVSLASETKHANLSCGNDSIYDDVTAIVPAIVIAIPKPPPLPARLPPCSRRLPGQDFHWLKSTESIVMICKLSTFQLFFFLP